MSYIFIVLLSILVLLSVLGNCLVIFSAVFNKKLRKYTHVLIMNLALSDLLISAFSLMLRLLRLIAAKLMLHLSHLSSGSFCKYTICLTISLFGATNFNLLLLTIDRYFAVNHALYYRLLLKRYHKYIFIFTSWALAFTVGMLPIMVKDIRKDELNRTKDLTCTFASVIDQNYTAFVTMFTFFLPLLIMTVLYMKIVRKVKNMHLAYDFSNTRRHHIRTSLAPAVIRRRERRMSMGILSLLGAHTILLAPISILDLIQVFGRVSLPPLVVEILLLLTYTNPVINAPIYAAASRDYYQTFKDLLCCFGYWKRASRCCCKSVPAKRSQPLEHGRHIRIHRKKNIWYIHTAPSV